MASHSPSPDPRTCMVVQVWGPADHLPCLPATRATLTLTPILHQALNNILVVQMSTEAGRLPVVAQEEEGPLPRCPAHKASPLTPCTTRTTPCTTPRWQVRPTELCLRATAHRRATEGARGARTPVTGAGVPEEGAGVGAGALEGDLPDTADTPLGGLGTGQGRDLHRTAEDTRRLTDPRTPLRAALAAAAPPRAGTT